MIDMNKYITAETYATKHGMTQPQVIKEIKEGELVGQIYRGAWYVKNEAKENAAVEKYMNVNARSPGIAFVLAFLFGPIGAIYGSVIGGLILVLMAVFLIPGTGVAGAVLIWIASLIVGPVGAGNHNDQARASAELIAGDK